MPIKNEKGEVVLFLASHKDITKSKMSEDTDEEKGTLSHVCEARIYDVWYT